MKMRKAQTEATSERMMVSMDFFLLMDERTWLICGVEWKFVRCTQHGLSCFGHRIWDAYRRKLAADIAYL